MRRLAAYCRYLRQAIDARRREGERIAFLCVHAAREGEECVGPFLEGLETECGLWESLNATVALRSW